VHLLVFHQPQRIHEAPPISRVGYVGIRAGVNQALWRMNASLDRWRLVSDLGALCFRVSRGPSPNKTTSNRTRRARLRASPAQPLYLGVPKPIPDNTPFHRASRCVSLLAGVARPLVEPRVSPVRSFWPFGSQPVLGSPADITPPFCGAGISVSPPSSRPPSSVHGPRSSYFLILMNRICARFTATLTVSTGALCSNLWLEPDPFRTSRLHVSAVPTFPQVLDSTVVVIAGPTVPSQMILRLRDVEDGSKYSPLAPAPSWIVLTLSTPSRILGCGR
jgi:hypothetical protein